MIGHYAYKYRTHAASNCFPAFGCREAKHIKDMGYSPEQVQESVGEIYSGSFFFPVVQQLGRSKDFLTLPICSMGRLYIYLHERLRFMVHAGKISSPMEHLGWGFRSFRFRRLRWFSHLENPCCAVWRWTTGRHSDQVKIAKMFMLRNGSAMIQQMKAFFALKPENGDDPFEGGLSL